MAQVDSDTIGGFLSAVWQIIVQVLRLNPQAYEAFLAVPDSWALGLTILVIGGLSYTLGQSVVLFANRVSRGHFIFSLSVSALILVIGVNFWAFSIWLLAGILFGAQQSFGAVLTAVAFSFAPYLFGFLILLPYLGNIISYILRIWMLLAVIVGVQVTFQLNFLEAVVCSVLGWVLIELLIQIPFFRLESLDSWIWRFSTGKKRQLDTGDIVNTYVDEERPSTMAEGEE